MSGFGDGSLIVCRFSGIVTATTAGIAGLLDSHQMWGFCQCDLKWKENYAKTAVIAVIDQTFIESTAS